MIRKEINRNLTFFKGSGSIGPFLKTESGILNLILITKEI